VGIFRIEENRFAGLRIFQQPVDSPFRILKRRYITDNQDQHKRTMLIKFKRDCLLHQTYRTGCIVPGRRADPCRRAEIITQFVMRTIPDRLIMHKADPLIIRGESKPDYKTCIAISSAGALAEMRVPAVISVATPLITGFIFGAEFVGGLLIGTTLSSIMLALYTANAGGAWDNGKKYVENGHYGGKGSDAHKAAVVGDTVGDPLKDTVGPSLDILIKIMSIVSLISVSIFGKYNLFSLFMQ